MNTKHIEYLIIGQGLCGSFLSHYLIHAGKKVVVIDVNTPITASKIASGIINPVTGRRVVKTWLIDEVLPFAQQAYQSFETANNLSGMMKVCKVIDFHTTQQMKDAFEKRLEQGEDYICTSHNDKWSAYFNYYFGAGEISPCLLIDINLFLQTHRQQLIQLNALETELFDITACTISNYEITYKNIKAEKVIFCDGVFGSNNPYFKNLPFAINKGEALIASIPDLPAENIFKSGISIVPWKDNLFWIGSSYEWNYSDANPSAAFKERMTAALKQLLKVPFKIVDHFAALRPANVERRPFVGLHPDFKNVGILNGMGTKGTSLAPFFAKQFADFLCNNIPVYPEADVKRFEKVLQR